MTDNIIGFNKPTTVAPVEQTYDYEFTLRDGIKTVEHGLLSFNPVFAATVNTDGQLLFAVPMENIISIKRLEPRQAFNA